MSRVIIAKVYLYVKVLQHAARLQNVVTLKTWHGQLFCKQATAKQMNCLFLLSGLQL